MSLLRRGTGAFTDFFDVLRQVRTDEIAAEADRSFRVAVVGARDAGKTTLISRLAGGPFGGLLEPFGLRRMIELDAPLTAEAVQAAYESDVVLWVHDATRPYVDDTFSLLRANAPAFLNVANKADLLVGLQDAEFRMASSPPQGTLLVSALSTASLRESLVPAILDVAPDLGLALGRSFSIFRGEVAEREILRVARVNAEVAVISAIPQASILLGPASALADTLILTKNQGMLILRLAAMYGLTLDRRRLTELAPVVGASFGWRTLARELVGFVPAGFGVVPKAIIAYAGTVAVGRGAVWYYQTGRKMPERQLRDLRTASLQEAKQFVRTITQRFKRPA